MAENNKGCYDEAAGCLSVLVGLLKICLLPFWLVTLTAGYVSSLVSITDDRGWLPCETRIIYPHLIPVCTKTILDKPSTVATSCARGCEPSHGSAAKNPVVLDDLP